MLSRGLLAAVAMAAVFAVPAWLLLGLSAPRPPDAPPAGPSAMAPQAPGGAVAATLSTRLPATPAPAEESVRALTVGRGDTLAKLLRRAGVGSDDAHDAIAALARLYEPRRLQPGQEVTLRFAEGRFLGLTLSVDFARRIQVARTGGDGFDARQWKRPLDHEPAWAGGVIRANLFDDAKAAGAPLAIIIEIIRVYSWDVDFQRDIRPGDSFEVVFERFFDEAGRPVHSGPVLGAVLRLRGKRLAVYRFTTADGDTDYFDERGRSARKALMRTPIDGARLSSRFGKRRHPILGYTRMHRGIDFAAPRGTPIYAAGKGTVTAAARNGAYGRYVRIRHNGRYSTAYAHLRAFKRGLRAGRRVAQGEVIGYVGSSGRSTGPHLHYEILEQGRRVNPLKLKMPSGRRLAGAHLARFEAARRRLDDLARALADPARLAPRAD